MKKIMLLFCFYCLHLSAAEVIPVQSIKDCFLCSSKPTLTMYWAAKDAKAVVIYLPGGTGFFGLREGQSRVSDRFTNNLAKLAGPEYGSEEIDFVLMDTPQRLSPDHMYPTARGSKEHLIRIESVVNFYKNKTHLPVWLLGHSTGGISLSKFVEYLQDSNQLNLIDGVVASAVRNETYFNSPIQFPMLFIHHEADECMWTEVSESFKNYKNVKSFNTKDTQFVLISGGEPEGDPCTSGFHMYKDSEVRFVNEVRKFILRH